LLAATAILGSAAAGATDYKAGTWQTPTINTPPLATAPASPPDPYNPGLGWQTRQPSLICESYFRVKDGEKAALSGDKRWLAETGCIIGPGGLRLVLLDTPDYKVSDAWRARLYGLGSDSRDVYLRSVDAVGFANAGTHKSEKDAQIALAEMNRRWLIHQGRIQVIRPKVFSSMGSVPMTLMEQSAAIAGIWAMAPRSIRQPLIIAIQRPAHTTFR